MMISILTMLQALTASAITPPVPLTTSATQVTPTAAARALSVAALDQLPPEPVTVTLQCLAGSEGRLTDCIAAGDGGTADLAVYRQRLFALDERVKADPILAAALARMPFYRVRPVRASSKAIASVLVSEIISSADQAPRDSSRGMIPKGELGIDPDSLVTTAGFYPRAALRAGAQTQVTATCRVLTDRSLFCRDPQVVLPAIAGDLPLWRVPAFDPDFGRATLRALATMHAQPRTAVGEDSVGHEVSLTMTWRLP